MNKFILLVVFLSCSASSLADVKTLDAFETELDQAFPVLLAEDQLETSKFAKDKVNSKNGWKLFGNLSSGYINSVQDVNRNYNYLTVIGKAGAIHPLLGTAEKERQLLAEAGKDIAVNELNLEWVKKKIRIQLAEDYAKYWAAQQKEIVGKEYSELAGTVSRLLHHREAKGVLLKSDRMEAMTAFERSRYEDIQNRDAMHEAIESMTAYLGHDIQPFVAAQPLLGPLIKDDFQLDLNQHHELKVIAAMIEAQTITINNNQWRGVESDFIVSGSENLNSDSKNLNRTDVGYGLVAGVNVQIPLSISSYRKADKNYASSILKRLNTEYNAKQRQLQAEVDALFRRYDRLNELIGYQETRLAAVSEMVRERALRMQKLDEDVIEKYLQALYEYYRVTMDYIDAQTEKWQIQIKLAEFIEIQNEPNTLVDHNALIAPLKKASLALKGKKAETEDNHIHMQGLNGLSIYLWDSEEPLDSSSQSFWQRMSEQGISRILLSLNQKQIDQYQSRPDQLNNFLNNAGSQGVKVDLLLGEPSWMLSENRGQLLTIIRSLKQFNFNALHLDLEINQLDESLSQEDAFNDWLDTVKAAAAESRWPVAISSHPRYLQKNLAGFDCFVCKLHEAGVSEITVMIYVTNPVNVLKTMTPLMKDYPYIKFSVAQSIEKQLNPENSYASYAQDKFLNHMMKLQATLKVHDNFSGLVIQSWRDLEEYLYENTVR